MVLDIIAVLIVLIGIPSAFYNFRVRYRRSTGYRSNDNKKIVP